MKQRDLENSKINKNGWETKVACKYFNTCSEKNPSAMALGAVMKLPYIEINVVTAIPKIISAISAEITISAKKIV